MFFLKNILGKNDKPIEDNLDFWDWFQKNAKNFFDVVKDGKDIEKEFFEKLSSKLEEIKDGFFFLTGMADNDTAELILTADGNLRNIAFVEDLVQSAPHIDGWKFTALKPAANFDNASIKMDGFQFNTENMFFYSNDYDAYPDEIDITVIHKDLRAENRQQIINGIYIFLDNYLGELPFAEIIDNIEIISLEEAQKELVPIGKLESFLVWRQIEFIEKYEGSRYNTENDEHSVLEAEFESGENLIAIVNSSLLNWDRKASHPWIVVVKIKFDGSDNNGMPKRVDYDTMNVIEDELMQELKDKDGFLNVGRQTAKSEREIYFACKDFRKPSKVLYKMQQEYADQYEMEYDIYKDKYWQSFERFKSSVE